MKYKSNKNEIFLVLKKYFNDYYNISLENTKEMNNKPLTGAPFYMTGSDLYRTLMYIEDYYKIYFNPSIFEKYKFNSIDNIINLIVDYKYYLRKED